MPNERTSGNGAIALCFYVQRLSRAVPEPGVDMATMEKPPCSPEGAKAAWNKIFEVLRPPTSVQCH